MRLCSTLYSRDHCRLGSVSTAGALEFQAYPYSRWSLGLRTILFRDVASICKVVLLLDEELLHEMMMMPWAAALSEVEEPADLLARDLSPPVPLGEAAVEERSNNRHTWLLTC